MIVFCSTLLTSVNRAILDDQDTVGACSHGDVSFEFFVVSVTQRKLWWRFLCTQAAF